jgi:hypothetical protein
MMSEVKAGKEQHLTRSTFPQDAAGDRREAVNR